LIEDFSPSTVTYTTSPRTEAQNKSSVKDGGAQRVDGGHYTFSTVTFCQLGAEAQTNQSSKDGAQRVDRGALHLLTMARYTTSQSRSANNPGDQDELYDELMGAPPSPWHGTTSASRSTNKSGDQDGGHSELMGSTAPSHRNITASREQSASEIRTQRRGWQLRLMGGCLLR
jgi:hypothetical protein